MNSRRILVVVTALAQSSAVTALAVTPVSALSPARVVALKMLETHNKAFMAKDLNGIMALYAPQAVVVDHSAPRVFIGRAAIRGWFKSIFAMPGQTTGVYKLLTTGRHGGVVWFTSRLISSRVHQGRTITARLRLSGVLVKRAGAWRVAQIHLSMMPKGSH